MAAAPGSDGAEVPRLEIILLAVFSLTWLAAVFALFRMIPLAGILPLGLYQLYSTAAALGWVAGNVYVHRQRVIPRARFRGRLLLGYLIGPPSLIYLLRALAPQAVQDAAPLVPLYSFFVYGLFFLVPITLKPPRLRRPR